MRHFIADFFGFIYSKEEKIKIFENRIISIEEKVKKLEEKGMQFKSGTAEYNQNYKKICDNRQEIEYYNSKIRRLKFLIEEKERKKREK